MKNAVGFVAINNDSAVHRFMNDQQTCAPMRLQLKA